MTENLRKRLFVIFLSLDVILLILGVLNFRLFINKAGLPHQYQPVVDDLSFNVKNIYRSEKITEFGGKEVANNGQLEFYLLSHKYNDTVKIKSVNPEGIVTEKDVALVKKYNTIDLMVMSLVALFYLFTGVFILLSYRDAASSYVIHAVAISVGAMIIFEWGDIYTYNSFLNFIFLWLFEVSIYTAPLMFLHFSFAYPVKGKESHFVFLTPFYCATLTFIIIATIHLVKIFFLGADITSLSFITFHTTVADVYLAVVLILTIAKLEHSTLTLTHAHYKKQIYWVLLGIMFGPLIYVFLFLAPRILLGYELVSAAFMQFTFVVAPITLLISITRKRKQI